jgi:WS/DGAT/MGAT family acyltransferase
MIRMLSLPSLMPPTSSMFLIPETREQPMHVGGLQLFVAPEGSGPDTLAELYREMVHSAEVGRVFRRRPHRSLATLGQWTWIDERDVDLEHHVRHSALPRPGRVRELLALVSRLHSTLLDRKRPLWETHLIEGLEDGRFAVYTKVHHALMDGIAAMKLLERSLSTDPGEMDMPMPFGDLPPRPRRGGGGDDASGGVMEGVRLGASVVNDAVTLTPKLVELGLHTLRTLPGEAPKSMLNVDITGSRRFAADAWEIDRLRAVGRKAEATLNDVVLAMCSSALRDYMLAEGALPDEPLIAMTPVSLRAGEDAVEGNAVGAILCNLATDLDDPEARLLAVRDSMRAGKASLAGLSTLQITALSALTMAPLLVNSSLGAHRYIRPAFNLIISNVPGPRQEMYWNGARLDGHYPMSIPLSGQALNITVTSYAGHMNFGLIGCRRSLPHMQRLLHGLDTALLDLEKAFL